jgi:hypothetical protein
VEVVVAVLTLIRKHPEPNRIHVLVESPIPSGLDGPFLVTSSKDMIWISKAFPNGMVRFAIQNTTLSEMFRGMVIAVAKRSRDEGWGSVHEPTAKGLQAVAEHLADYELTDIEVLYGSGFNESMIPEGTPREEVDWVPDGWALVLPKDRAYVGTVIDFEGGQLGGVLHNASRGIGICANEVDEITLQSLVLAGALPPETKNLYGASRANRRNGLPAIRTLDQLTRMTRGRLMKYHRVGSRTVDKIEAYLRESGRSLAES